MNLNLAFIPLYPYNYQLEAMLYSTIFLLLIFFIIYGLYRLVTWNMGPVTLVVFHKLLIAGSIAFVTFFFISITLTLITICQVNNQLGFGYATPDTPEGEIFEITRVEPGKIMDKAGLKALDRVLMYKVNDLYILLIEHQGDTAVFEIMREGEKVDIRVGVPELRLPLGKGAFWW